MHDYDFIMAGGGLAGLSLAHKLSTETLPGSRILIIDAERPGSSHRTWCYWSVVPGSWEKAVSHSWDRIRFSSRTFDKVLEMHPFQYRMVRGRDYYDLVLGALESSDGVEFLTEEVTSITDSHAGPAAVHTATREFTAEYVFDSRFYAEDYVSSSSRFHRLMQHFRGWEVETELPSFDPKTPTLFDFHTPQNGEMRFMYVMPFSETRALVEFTIFGAELLTDEEYSQALEAYLDFMLGGRKYRVVDTENGVIPMTDEPFPRRPSPHVLNTGTRGGRVKPSTGYAFKRVQDDTERIARSLETHGHPFDVGPHRNGFLALDTMLLQIMYRRGELSEQVFTDLFQRNPPERLFRFLDEQTGVWETIKVMATVPWGPFIRAGIRTKLLGRI